MTNVVEFKAPDLTPSERERVERLVWTENQGRGWKPPAITSTDLPFLQALEQRLEGRQAPADKEIVVAHLARLANHHRADRPAEAWQMLFEDYLDDLDGISGPHLREAIKTHRAESNWFPKPAELVGRWNTMKASESEQLRRARVLLGREDPKPWEVK